LYPTAGKNVIPYKKAVIDLHLSTIINPLVYYLIKYIETQDARIFDTIQKTLMDINEKYLKYGTFAEGIIGYQDITVLYIILYPIIDSFYKEPSLAIILPSIKGNHPENWYKDFLAWIG
jgi:hypothetical protein